MYQSPPKNLVETVQPSHWSWRQRSREQSHSHLCSSKEISCSQVSLFFHFSLFSLSFFFSLLITTPMVYGSSRARE